ncbi:hypothetical protein [Nitrospira sp. Nam80]
MTTRNHYFAIALGLSLLGTPVMAENDGSDPFMAISEIGEDRQGESLTPLSDSSLDSIEGAGICLGCPSINVNIAIAPIAQFNIINQVSIALGRNIDQSSFASAINNTGGSRGGR